MASSSSPSSAAPRSSCWSQCFWYVKTCNGARNNKVHPADPIPSVQVNGNKNKVNATKDLDEARSPNAIIQNEPTNATLDIQYSVVNQFFVPDENGEIHQEDDATSESCTGRVIPIQSHSKDFYLQNSIFLEIDKERRIRVVHLEPKKSDEENSPQQTEKINGEGVSSGAERVNHVPAPLESPKKPEEEDEYWFSKWTRKPRFRSIFEKNTIHGSTEEEEGENNNGDTPPNANVGAVTESIDKDFEIARAAVAAKRRAWAYNNSGSSEPEVQESMNFETEEEEYNSITVCETSQKWTKNAKTKDAYGKGSEEGNPMKSMKTEQGDGCGITNLAFEDDTVKMDEEEQEVVHERAVDCPPDFISPVKNLSLKRGASSPSPSNTSSTSSSQKKRKGKHKKEREESPLSLPPSSSSDAHPVVDKAKVIEKTPLIFLIHGISESSEIWKAQTDFFHNLGYEVVVPDLLGHGFSSAPQNAKYYQFESLAQDLLSIFDYFVEEERKTVVIGHGYGASLASIIVRLRPKSCNILISISGGGPTPLVKRACCRGSWIPFYCQLFHSYTKAGRFINPELRNVLPSIIRDHIVNGQVWTDGDSTFYRRISVPTLLVYGMKDKVVNLVEVCEMERTIPKSFLEVIGSAGHMVMLDEPVVLNKMLGKFIQSWL